MRTIHLISHTHWDREWYLTYQQFRLKLVHLVDNLLLLLARDLDFKYFMLDGQTIILEDYLQIRPEREKEINEYIKRGRLLIGPWYVSPDEFLVGPEAHIRNLLEGDWISQKFGKKMPVGYLPDPFGHIAQMPQILQGFGITTACVWRGLDDQPCEFMWKAPNGSKVLMSYLRDSYSNAAGLSTSELNKFPNEVNELCNSLQPYIITDQVLLMNGTDHMEPPKDLSNAIHSYQETINTDVLVHSTLPIYFEAVRENLNKTGEELPIITGELRSSKHSQMLPNVLSTRMLLKQRNFVCEAILLKWVEPFSAWANLLKVTSYSAEKESSFLIEKYRSPYISDNDALVRQAWRLLMQCHPHDSICGCTIDQVAEEISVRFDQVEQIGEEITRQSLQRIADLINTKYVSQEADSNQTNEITMSLIVFNPNQNTQTELSSVDIQLPQVYTKIEIIDQAGTPVPYELSGMGGQELITMSLDQKGFKNVLGMIHEGRAAGMVVIDFKMEQQGNQVIINATLSNNGEPDLNAWRRGITQAEELLSNPSIKTYIIHARSVPETKVSFIASDIPGFGYRTFWISGLISPNSKRNEPPKLNRLIQILLPLANYISRIPFISKLVQDKPPKKAKPPYIIENDYFKVEINTLNSTLTITDKRNDQVFAGQNSFLDGGDCGDEYNYCPPVHDSIFTANFTSVFVEKDSIHQKLEVHYVLMIPAALSNDRKSRSKETVKVSIKSEITLVPGVPRIDIHTEVDNQARDHRLRVHFPAPFNTAYSNHDGHFEIIQRPIGVPDFDDTWIEHPRPEVPQRAFTSISNGQLNLTIANRGLPEVEVLENNQGNSEIALTLLRCVGWLSRDDFTTRKGHAGPMGLQTLGAQMQGKFTFDYSIIPQPGDWHNSIEQAYAFNAPFRTISANIHAGLLPSLSSMIDVLSKSFIITAIKMSEDQTSLIIRGFNPFPDPIDIAIKTWRQFAQVSQVNLDESVIDEKLMTKDGYTVLQAGGNQIVTIKYNK